ncbi:MAG: ATP-binding protein, partial [Chloroflexota bacterium]
MDDLNFPNPVTTAKDFFDRELELDTIQRTLASPTRRPVVILGERVIGKTSTLNILVERLKASPSFAIVRLPHSYSRDDFAAEILQGICEAVDTSLRQTGFVNGDGCLKIATVSEFMQMTEEQIAKRPGVSFVLCLDEFDSLLARCDADTANQIL